MRVLVDTNVLISAFIASGVCDEFLEYCEEKHLLISSSRIYEEFKSKLLTKFKVTNDDLEALTDILGHRLVFVEPVVLGRKVCRDPKDDHVLAAAKGGDCDCIVTGDSDLLVLRSFEGIPIIKPSQFWEWEAQKGVRKK